MTIMWEQDGGEQGNPTQGQWESPVTKLLKILAFQTES